MKNAPHGVLRGWWNGDEMAVLSVSSALDGSRPKGDRYERNVGENDICVDGERLWSGCQ